MTGQPEHAEREALGERVGALIDRLADGSRDDPARDGLLRQVASWQARHVEPYRRLVSARGVRPQDVASIDELPAIPTDVFRFARVAAHAADADVRVFRTSGTTASQRGLHALRKLDLYDRAARAAARYALFPDRDRLPLLIVAPDEAEAPESSLTYMLARFVEWFGADWFGEGPEAWILPEGRFDLERMSELLTRAEMSGQPVALLGTSFAFVHLDEILGGTRFRLPAGSRIMQTGGFKGRSREIPPDAMRSLLAKLFGVPDSFVVSEYGMTELSSQMYEPSLRMAVDKMRPGPRHLWVPGWVRATPVDPETLVPVSGDEVGILRVDDLANLDTACCIQTSDLARRRGEGIEVLGRQPGSTPRGCSLAADVILQGA